MGIGPLELTSSIVLVILDEERDGVKHILLSHIVPLGAVICFFDVIMFYTGVVLTYDGLGEDRDCVKHYHIKETKHFTIYPLINININTNL